MNTNIIIRIFISIICFSGTIIKAEDTETTLNIKIPEYLVTTYTGVISATGTSTRVSAVDGTCTIKTKGYRPTSHLYSRKSCPRHEQTVVFTSMAV